MQKQDDYYKKGLSKAADRRAERLVTPSLLFGCTDVASETLRC